MRTCLPKCWGLSCDTCCHDDALQDKSVWWEAWQAKSFSCSHEAATLACKLMHKCANIPTHTHCLFTSFFFVVFLHFLFFLRFSTRFSKRAQPALRRCRICRFAMQICLHENEGSCPDLPRPLAQICRAPLNSLGHWGVCVSFHICIKCTACGAASALRHPFVRDTNTHTHAHTHIHIEYWVLSNPDFGGNKRKT